MKDTFKILIDNFPEVVPYFNRYQTQSSQSGVEKTLFFIENILKDLEVYENCRNIKKKLKEKTIHDEHSQWKAFILLQLLSIINEKLEQDKIKQEIII